MRSVSPGPHSFTGKLKALVEAVEANSGPESASGDGEEANAERRKREEALRDIGLPQLRSIKDLHINVEGPYGVTLGEFPVVPTVLHRLATNV